jgi:hypothetical protein
MLTEDTLRLYACQMCIGVEEVQTNAVESEYCFLPSFVNREEVFV